VRNVRFNARNRAANIYFESINGILNLAHKNNCKVFITLNIIIVGSEVPALIRLLNQLVNTRIDGVIVQDLGLFYLLSKYFKGIEIHASTQLNTHNVGQVHFLRKLNAARANLSRELNIDEIKALTVVGHKNNIQTEVFVHGSYCISFSGICYISSVHGGNSGNRGRCSQPCRDRYLTTPEGKNFPLNLKDNSAYFDLREITDAGVASIKIEGRMKKFGYVYTVVDCWKKQIRRFYAENRLNMDNRDLYRVFNRDFSDAYLKGDINKSMFIDNPRDHSLKHLNNIYINSTHDKLGVNRIEPGKEKAGITARVKNKIKRLSIAKVPLIISISGKPGTLLKISVKTPDTSFVVCSKVHLVKADPYIPDQHSQNQKADLKTILADGKKPALKSKKIDDKFLNYTVLLEKLRPVNDTEYSIKELELENLQKGLFLPFKELTSIKKRILFILNGSKDFIDPDALYETVLLLDGSINDPTKR